MPPVALSGACCPIRPPADRFDCFATIGLYVLGFAVLAWPWMSGRVTIPWDAKSNSFPNLSFLARSLAQGQSPFWTPNIYAGWPQIADPQSLIFSPLHFALALFDATPSFVAADAVVFALLFIGGLGVILIFRERGWHEGGALVAALAFAFGGSNASRIQHIGQIESICWLPLALFLLMRALDRVSNPTSWRWGARGGAGRGLDRASGAIRSRCSASMCWRHMCCGTGSTARAGARAVAASVRPLAAGAIVGAVVIAVPVLLTALLAASSNRPEVGYDITIRGSLHPADLLTLVFADLFGAADPKVPYWGPPSFPWHERVRLDRSVSRAEHRPALRRRAGDRRGDRFRHRARAAVVARGPLLHRDAGADAALRARQVHAGVPGDVRASARRVALSPPGGCDVSCSA